MESRTNVEERLQDAFFELLYHRSLHDTVYDEGLVQKCECTLSQAAPINPRLENYLKQIVEQVSAERNLKTKIEWLMDEVEEAGGRSLDREERVLLSQEAEIEDWLLDQVEHFDERFSALCNGATAIAMTPYRDDDLNQRTVLSKDGETSSQICLTLHEAVTEVAKWPKADKERARFKVAGKRYDYTWADLEDHVPS